MIKLDRITDSSRNDLGRRLANQFTAQNNGQLPRTFGKARSSPAIRPRPSQSPRRTRASLLPSSARASRTSGKAVTTCCCCWRYFCQPSCFVEAVPTWREALSSVQKIVRVFTVAHRSQWRWLRSTSCNCRRACRVGDRGQRDSGSDNRKIQKYRPLPNLIVQHG